MSDPRKAFTRHNRHVLFKHGNSDRGNSESAEKTRVCRDSYPMTSNRFWAWAAIVIGIMGCVACAAAIACFWVCGSRLARANAEIFAGIDKSLVAVHGRLLDVRQLLGKMKITTEDVGVGLRKWARKQATERVSSRLQIEEKAGQLAKGMERVDEWMETSEASLQLLKQTFEVVESVGAPVDGALLDPLIGKVSALHGDLKQATRAVEGIRERAAELGADQERLQQAMELAGRVVVTMSDLDSRITELADKVPGIQTKAQLLKARIAFAIRAAQLAAILLLAWMAAGQASLYSLGRTRLRLSVPDTR